MDSCGTRCRSTNRPGKLQAVLSDLMSTLFPGRQNQAQFLAVLSTNSKSAPKSFGGIEWSYKQLCELYRKRAMLPPGTVEALNYICTVVDFYMHCYELLGQFEFWYNNAKDQKSRGAPKTKAFEMLENMSQYKDVLRSIKAPISTDSRYIKQSDELDHWITNPLYTPWFIYDTAIHSRNLEDPRQLAGFVQGDNAIGDAVYTPGEGVNSLRPKKPIEKALDELITYSFGGIHELSAICAGLYKLHFGEDNKGKWANWGELKAEEKRKDTKSLFKEMEGTVDVAFNEMKTRYTKVFGGEVKEDFNKLKKRMNSEIGGAPGRFAIEQNQNPADAANKVLKEKSDYITSFHNAASREGLKYVPKFSRALYASGVKQLLFDMYKIVVYIYFAHRKPSKAKCGAGALDFSDHALMAKMRLPVISKIATANAETVKARRKPKKKSTKSKKKSTKSKKSKKKSTKSKKKPAKSVTPRRRRVAWGDIY
jgi:hypothetical protein